MKKRGILSAVVVLLAYSLSGYSRPTGDTSVSTPLPTPAYITCREPRPEICYEIYAPVCATRANNAHCLTQPCPPAEQVTFSNDCTACADNHVQGYIEGECPQPATL
jgi:hypothetical protein